MLDRLNKRVGFLLTFFGVAVFIANSVSRFYSGESILLLDLNLIVLICSIAIFISSFFPIGKYIQVFGLGFATLFSLYDTPDDGVTFGVLILILLLMYKYKFFEKRVVFKVSLTFSIIIGVIIFGTLKDINIALQSSNLGLVDILQEYTKNLIFFLIFLSTLILIMYDEIAIYVKREKKYKKEIKDLNVTIEQTQEYLKKIDTNFIDPIQAGLTKKELILLESLCLYRESNIDLAQRLGKSPNTIKVQLTRVMNKIGAETRYQLIDLCRHYFIGNKSENNIDTTI